MNIRHNSSGIILVVVLAVIAVLTIFALSAGALTSTVSRYAEKEFAKTRAFATALAGVRYTINLMHQYPCLADSLFQSGVAVASSGQAQQYFTHVVLDKNAWFDVTISDQARRFNLNALNETTVGILAGLIKNHGFSASAGQQIANSALIWKTEKKKAAFDDIAELVMMEGMSPEIFNKVHQDLTIYPLDASMGLKVNYWTVSEPLLHALMQDLAMNRKIENLADMSSLVAKYRMSNAPISPDATEIAKMAPAGHVPMATDYQIRAVGMDGTSNTQVIVDAYVSKDPNGEWHIVRVNRL